MLLPKYDKGEPVLPDDSYAGYIRLGSRSDQENPYYSAHADQFVQRRAR
jgi:hypothetical protein